MKTPVEHKTVIIRKNIKVPAAKVFAAFARVKARAVWSVPKGDAIKYAQTSFKVGGKDVFRCGTPGVLEFKGIVQYHEITKNFRIISTETLSHAGKILSVALLATEFIESKNSTSIIVTAQIFSLDGSDMSKGYKQGWTGVLNNLEEYLRR